MTFVSPTQQKQIKQRENKLNHLQENDKENHHLPSIFIEGAIKYPFMEK